MPDTNAQILHNITLIVIYAFLRNTPFVDITQGEKRINPEVKLRHPWAGEVCTIHVNDEKQ